MRNTKDDLRPKVSICVVTYNHEAYVDDCIASVLQQKTDFRFEIIVGDDCSTDRTREILTYHKNRHPTIVKPVFNERNIGGSANLMNICSLATGDYIAHCDGDDLWLPGKLQYQIEVLEANPDISGVFTNAIRSSRPINSRVSKDVDISRSLGRIFTDNPLIRSTFVERRFDAECSKRLLEHLSIDNTIFDFELYWLVHKDRTLRLLGEPYIVYNDHPAGFSKDSGRFAHYRKAIERLKTAGLTPATYAAMLLDLQVSGYLTSLDPQLRVNLFKWLTSGRQDLRELMKISMPPKLLAFLRNRRNAVHQFSVDK